MALAFSILSEWRLLCIRGVGVITQGERLQTMRAWLADPAYQDCNDALCDFSQAESTPTMADLRELVGLMAQHLPARGPRRLAMVTSKPITFVVAGEFKEFVEQSAVPLEVKVFADFQSAWQWLRPANEAAAEPAPTGVTPPRR
jgi:stage II sporulation SpoAA-like protein